jgi:hypothetical protein
LLFFAYKVNHIFGDCLLWGKYYPYDLSIIFIHTQQIEKFPEECRNCISAWGSRDLMPCKNTVSVLRDGRKTVSGANFSGSGILKGWDIRTIITAGAGMAEK